jgi:hypothetical protein
LDPAGWIQRGGCDSEGLQLHRFLRCPETPKLLSQLEQRACHPTSDRAKALIVFVTALIGILVLASSVVFYIASFFVSSDRLAILKDVYALTIVQALLPMFTTLVASVLTFIFGRVIVESIGARIRGAQSG